MSVRLISPSAGLDVSLKYEQYNINFQTDSNIAFNQNQFGQTVHAKTSYDAALYRTNISISFERSLRTQAEQVYNYLKTSPEATAQLYLLGEIWTGYVSNIELTLAETQWYSRSCLQRKFAFPLEFNGVRTGNYFIEPFDCTQYYEPPTVTVIPPGIYTTQISTMLKQITTQLNTFLLPFSYNSINTYADIVPVQQSFSLINPPLETFKSTNIYYNNIINALNSLRMPFIFNTINNQNSDIVTFINTNYFNLDLFPGSIWDMNDATSRIIVQNLANLLNNFEVPFTYDPSNNIIVRTIKPFNITIL